MEKRSRRRIRDLVARPASLGLSENETGCARISMMARNTTFRSRAGYRSARPITSKSSLSACNARPVHTVVPSLPDEAGMDSRITVRFYTVVHREFGQAGFEACLNTLMGLGGNPARTVDD